MAVQAPQMPGYRLNEYLAIIAPNEDLSKRIMKVKERFATTYDAYQATYARPHITLVSFVTWTMMEERLRNRFRHIAMGTRPFKVELRDFGSYPSHTIFINIATKLPLQELSKQIRSAQRLMKADPENKPHFLSDPHILIARKLKPWQYEKGWLEYSHQHFSAKMIADSLLLMKRPLEETGAYQIVERFEFQNLPVTTVQGELFC